MKRILIDTNIIIDLLLKREPFFEEAIMLLLLKTKHNFVYVFTATSITDIFYISRKKLGNKEATLQLIDLCKIMSIASVNEKIIHKALHSNFSDFEDAVQHETAFESNIDVIITRNKTDFKHSKVKVLLPKEFINLFK